MYCLRHSVIFFLLLETKAKTIHPKNLDAMFLDRQQPSHLNTSN